MRQSRQGVIVNIFSLGRRRLTISIRLERLPGDSQAHAEQLYFDRQARDAALAERTRWEVDHFSRSGFVR
jgi:hypothetical protein